MNEKEVIKIVINLLRVSMMGCPNNIADQIVAEAVNLLEKIK